MRLAAIAALLCLAGCAHQAKECACVPANSETPPPPGRQHAPVMCWGEGDTRRCDEIGEFVILLASP